jgi:hypothetical protein
MKLCKTISASKRLQYRTSHQRQKGGIKKPYTKVGRGGRMIKEICDNLHIRTVILCNLENITHITSTMQDNIWRQG